MTAEVLVDVDDVCMDYKQGGAIWQRSKQFRALDHVSLKIFRGDAIGLIGRNGAGKTTLLKLLAGILLPSSGTVRRFTDSITLLSLGAGYEPSIPARDNVILNGMLLGVPRAQMEGKLDAIFDYAELRNFRKMPMKNYSSGMKSRLAFATALHVQTDVMLIDEVFAVGDAEFRIKSDKTMTARIEAGQTLVLVSHQVATVSRLCQRVIWFEQGRLVADGPVREVLAEYLPGKQPAGK